MFDMFGNGMANNYEDRKIDNTEVNGAIIDTCSVTDTEAGFETAIIHPSYNNGKWIVVEEYYSKDKAIKGHKEWVKLFEKELPEELKDVSTCEIVKLAGVFGCELNEVHKKDEVKTKKKTKKDLH